VTCWVCCEPIEDPPEIIGELTALRAAIRTPRVAHVACLRMLGEYELELRGEGTGPA
jgi:hypothetical protein